MELEKIAKRIQNIEDKCTNFKTNKTWLKLRKMQDMEYCIMAQEQIQLLKEKQKYSRDKLFVLKAENKIRQLNKFINKTMAYYSKTENENKK